jgi:hypothetical protein
MMPFKYDPEGSGTHDDGSRSALYCSYCYQNGKFTQPDITLPEMKARVVDQLVKMKYPRFVAKLMTTGMGKRVRWKN